MNRLLTVMLAIALSIVMVPALEAGAATDGNTPDWSSMDPAGLVSAATGLVGDSPEVKAAKQSLCAHLTTQFLADANATRSITCVQWGDFAKSLREADVVFLTEIYAAREKPMPGVSAAMIAGLNNQDVPGRARFVADEERLADELIPVLKPGDLVVVMGAGDIRSAAEAVLARLNMAQKVT